MSVDVRTAYSRRSSEYVELFGSMEPVHHADLHLVSTWAGTAGAPLIDAGCGPGQWTNHFSNRGIDARGIDQTPEFITRARAAYPGVRFDVGTLEQLGADDRSIGAVFAWYSLIHHHPDDIGEPLREFARVLRPGGGLLVGFFTGPSLEPFDHAVITAYRWPVGRLAAEIRAAGFEVVETYDRAQAGARSQGAIIAVRAAPSPRPASPRTGG